MSLQQSRGLWFGVSLLVIQPPAPPVFETEVALVAVPVFVTDGSGKAVAGLTAADFEIQDGGKRVPIVAFQAIDVDAPAASAIVSMPGFPVAIQAAAARQFLLLFDLQFSPPAGLLRARMAAMRFVRESLAANDLVAVATFGRTGLKMLTGFTTDRSYVTRAINGLGVVPALEMASDPLGLSGAFEAPAGGDGLADQEIAEEMELLRVALKTQYQYRIADFLASLDDLARALAPLRGRKQIVLLSGGYAQEGWADSSAVASPTESFEQNRNDPLMGAFLRDKMHEVFRKAGVSDVVVHSVDLRGIEGPVDVASQTGRNERRGEGGLALRALAENTGGHFVRPTNDFGLALREMEQVSRHYYVLAFQPAEPAPKVGRPRGVKVRVNRDGLRVSHRAAYVVPKSSPGVDAADARLAAAEAIAKGLSGGRLRPHLTAMPYRDRQGRASVPVVLHLDGEALAAAVRDDGLAVQVYGYALANGRVLDSLEFATTLDLSKVGASLRTDGLSVLTAFAASPGPVDIRFFVRAGGTGETGSIRRQLEVPAFTDGETVLSAPIRTLPATEKIVAPYETRGRPPVEIPFRLGGRPFLPDTSRVLTPGLPSELCVFVWPSRLASSEPLNVTGELAQPGQASQPLRFEGAPRVVADADGFDRYVVTVVPPRAAPGDYILRLTFRQPGTGWSACSETNISLQE
jgi:VWFA-related protein